MKLQNILLVLSLVLLIVPGGYIALLYTGFSPLAQSQSPFMIPANQGGQKTEKSHTVPRSNPVTSSAEVKGQSSLPVKSTPVPKEVETLADRLASDPKSIKILLQDMTGGNSDGFVYLLRKETELYQTVTARLPEPAPGNYYKGWMVKTLPRIIYFSTGNLDRLEDGRFFLSMNANGAYRDFTEYIVTLQTPQDPEGKPGRVILKGIEKSELP